MKTRVRLAILPTIIVVVLFINLVKPDDFDRDFEANRLATSSVVATSSDPSTAPPVSAAPPAAKVETPYRWPYHWVKDIGSPRPAYTPAIKTFLSEYTVLEFYDAQTCRGEVRIQLDASKCTNLLQRSISTNTTWDTYLKLNYGPDHYRLVYEGSEKIMALQQTAHCTTRLYYSFTLPGEYKPRLKLELNDFWGVNEIVHNTAHWKNKELSWLEIRRCDKTLQYHSEEGIEVLPGRWVRRSLLPSGYAPEGNKKAGSEWAWLPYESSLTPVIGKQLTPLSKMITTLKVIGDSQGRSLYHIIKNRLEAKNESDSAFKIKTKKETAVGGIHLSYEPNYFLEFNKTSLLEPDLLLTGTGPHPGSWGQWTFSEFEAKMHKIAEDVCSRKPPKATIWFGSPAWPKGKPSSEKNFRVTNPRMEIFNTLAKRAIKNTCSHVAFLDFYAMTIAQIKLSPDGAHYHKTVVLDAVVDEIIKIISKG